MASLFCDASAIVKRYANELGSSWVVGETDPASGNTIFVARITEVEVVSGITRRVREGTLSSNDGSAGTIGLRADFVNQYRVIEITAALIDNAISLVQNHGLRGYDAVQLAAALEVHSDRMHIGLPPLVFCSADRALNTAALAEGLAVDNPNTHP
jgi:predicted nucleic acid-binding protein